MMAAGETNIGGIVGFLRLEADQFHREIQQALLEIEALDNKDVRVSVKTDGAGGLERLPSTARTAGRSLDDLASASRRLADADGRLADATTRVNIATLKLSELNESGKAKASQMMTAQQNLARAQQGLVKAQRDQQDAAYATYEANIQLGQANEEVAESTDKAEQSTRRLSKSTNEARGHNRALIAAIVTLGPAIVPVAAAAAGLAAGFAGMATAGVLAVVGIKREMKLGTDVGRAYTAGIAELKTGMESVAEVAATNFLDPFQDAVVDITQRIPDLTDQLGELSTITGRTAGNLVGGLLSAFQALEPLMRDASVYILDLSSRFKEAMSGPGIVSFGDYVRSVFPQVMDAVEALVTAAGHLIEALAPLGLGVVQGIKVFSDMLNAIPTDVLSTIIQLASSVYIGFTIWKTLSGPLSALSAALGGVAGMSQRAATGMRALQISAGVIGIALAGLSYVFTANAEETRKNEDAINDWADALRASNGVIDESIREKMRWKLADEGVLDAGRQLGYNLNDITEAALGNVPAFERVQAHTKAIQQSFVDAGQAGGDFSTSGDDVAGKMDLVSGAIGVTNGQLDAGAQKFRDVQAAAENTGGALSGGAAAMQYLADTYGTSATVLQKVIDGQQALADKAAAATLQMQLENDAAGLLKQSLDELNGETQGLAQAQNAFDRSQLAVANPIQSAKEAEARARAQLEAAKDNTGGGPTRSAKDSLAKAQLAQTQAQQKLNRLMGDSKTTVAQLEAAQNRLATANLRVAQAQGKIAGQSGPANAAAIAAAEANLKEAEAATKASKALLGKSEQAITNRGNIIQDINNAEAVAEAYGKEKDSAEAGRLKLIELREQIIKNAVAQGMNKDEVIKFVNELLKVPKTIPPTQAELNIQKALKQKKALQDAINAITGKTVVMTIQQVFQQIGSNAARQVHNEQTLARHGHNPNLSKGGPIPGYATGTLIGPGTGTSDSILAQVAETGRLMRVSAGEFVSTDASRKRNLEALEAGNRGATLTIASGIPKGGDVLRVSSARPSNRGQEVAAEARHHGKGASARRMHPEDIKAIGKELALAVRQMPRPRVDVDDFNRRLA